MIKISCMILRVHLISLLDGNLVASKELSKHSNVFLLKHTWTSEGSADASKQIKKDSKLIDRLAKLVKVPEIQNVKDILHSNDQIQTVADFCKCSDEVARDALNESNGDLVNACVGLSLNDGKSISDEKKAKNEEKEVTFEEFKDAMQASGNLDSKNPPSEAYLRKMHASFLKSGGSGVTMNYNWADDEGEGTITVYVRIPVSIDKKKIRSSLSSSKWRLMIGEEEMINGELFAAVKADDSYWSIEEPGLFCMTLEKVASNTPWKVRYDLCHFILDVLCKTGLNVRLIVSGRRGGMKSYLFLFFHFYICYRPISPDFKKCSPTL